MATPPGRFDDGRSLHGTTAGEERHMGTAPHPLGGPPALPREAIHVTGRRVLATSTDGLGFGFASYLIVLAYGVSAVASYVLLGDDR
jgi:hypothetical protein